MATVNHLFTVPKRARPTSCFAPSGVIGALAPPRFEAGRVRKGSMTLNSFLRKLSIVSSVAGFLILGSYGVLVIQAHMYRASEIRHFNSQLSQHTSKTPSLQAITEEKIPSSTPQDSGPATPVSGLSMTVTSSSESLLGILEIPRLGIETPVLEGVDDGTLRRAVGHIPGTALPADGIGNIGIAGHRDTLFRSLKDVEQEDVIILKTLTGDHRYLVDSIRVVEPNNVAVLKNIDQRTLTLVTCYPFNFVGPAPLRFVVQAREI
jgi:sortase A